MFKVNNKNTRTTSVTSITYLNVITNISSRIFDSVLIREYTGQRKPVFWHILRNEILPLKLVFPNWKQQISAQKRANAISARRSDFSNNSI